MKFSMKTVVISLLLATLLCVGASAAFVKTNTYSNGLFSDVKSDAWYASEVKSTYELGLMNGKGYGAFDPEGSVTVAEAITMAARASAMYKGETIAQSGTEWYDMYVNYAKSKGFVKDGQFDDFSRPAKRYEVAVLFENAMPDGYYTAKNSVEEIPDISEKQEYLDELLTLYNAGVVMGSDNYGHFFPENNITRAEAAAIINRVALPENRLEKKLHVLSNDDAYIYARVDSYDAQREGLASSWRLDNRAGEPRMSLFQGYAGLADVSTTESSALVRDLNKISTGRITLRTTVTVAGGFDGFALEFRNEADETVYKLVTDNNSWNVLAPDGSLVNVMANVNKSTENKFDFVITIDLDNGYSVTEINNINCGTHSLATSGDALNLYNFRFVTGKEETVSAALGAFDIIANYAVYDLFDWDTDPSGVKGWNTYLCDINTDLELEMKPGAIASRYFIPVSGTVMNRFIVLLDGQNFKYNLTSGGKPVITYEADDENLYVNGEAVYDYTTGIWYNLATEVDTFAHTAKIYLNGRVIKEIELENKATSVDGVEFYNTGDITGYIDEVKIYEKQHHDDYVPVPVKPAGEEKYTVGINVCSLWQDFSSTGWACISPYPDFEPILGYYDENIPELADWEIKYMVEHGIDFQAFCWFPNIINVKGKIKQPSQTHLYEGFMYAEYSDMMKYAILWEANSSSATSMKEWKEVYVPYLIEHYFKDGRYMTIENKPVLLFFAYGNVTNRIGGNEANKEMFAYLDQEVQKLGFDGMIYLAVSASGGGYEALDLMGYDGVSAYSWGIDGSHYATNTRNMSNAANTSPVYHVPTVSVGFNRLPWYGDRYQLMTMENYQKTNRWVRDEYFPTNTEKNSWQENFVMISTWNEHGEGTIVFPSVERGFGYLDVIRDVYTDAGIDESINTVPTPEQKARINRLYPQYSTLLRKQAIFDKEQAEKETEVIYTINYDNRDGNIVAHSNVLNGEVVDGGYAGTVNGDTAILASVDVAAEDVSYLKLTCELPAGQSAVQMFFTTTEDGTWEGSKKAATLMVNEDGYQEIYINTKGIAAWKGTINAVRLDPGQSTAGVPGNDFVLYKMEFLKPSGALSSMIEVDGVKSEMKLNAELSSSGEYLIAFDPSETIINFKLNAFHTWHRDAGELILELNGHKVVYTLGKTTYVLDGVEKELGFELYARDGLPMIPIKMLCDDVGYECTASKQDGLVINTPLKERIQEILFGGKPGEWEFNVNGNSDGWSGSQLISASSLNGALVLTSLDSSVDPQIYFEGRNERINIDTSEYATLEIRCRYKYTTSSGEPSSMQIFFTTNMYPTWSQASSMWIPLETTDTEGEWVTFTYDLTQLGTFKGTLTDLRLDPFVAYGTMDIDYIRFIKK